MLDTYRGVIDSLEHLNLAGLDQFAQMYEGVEAPSPIDTSRSLTPAVVGDAMGIVIDLNDYRRRRLA
jgi:hypothetical protein